MKIMIDMPDYKYKCLQKRIELGVASEMDVLVAKGKAIEQESKTEPCEDMERKIEKEYLFESLCEDLKKLQAENENLRNVLEQESCKDCISREYMYKLGAKCIAVRNENNALVAIASIESLPSVQPKTGWIPVSERLPETDDDVLACDGVDIFVAWYIWKGMWQGWNSHDNFERDTPIIAWMPLPEPYKESEYEHEQKTSQESI